MAVPNELSLEAIRDFMLENGGKVTNHDLVKHFKRFLTNPETRVEARNQFKEYVNSVATIRNEDGEKYLILKKKYRNVSNTSQISPGTPSDSVCSLSPTSLFPSSSFAESPGGSPSRQPPPYRAPPPPVSSPTRSTNDTLSSQDSFSEDTPAEVSKSKEPDEETVIHSPPPVPPRRKSSDKLRLENKENNPDAVIKRPKTIGAEANAKMEGEGAAESGDQKISVRERMQKFNRLASESDLARAQAPGNKKKSDRENAAKVDDGDSGSVTSLDAKTREWLVRSSQANYQELAKLASQSPRLARYKDPTSTALHWAAKHGNADVVKLIAGTYEADVNVRTGYTPLHLAMQFGHEDIYNLLVKVYGADPNLRDWSGRKPRQYQASQDTAVSADTFRKIKARKKHAEKDLGFLRIGSLNVRVKRTTEAFSNFLGVGHSSSEKLHKTWGSADNIQQVDRHIMPPPKFAPIKKRKSKKAQDFATSHSTPSTPPREVRTSSVQPTPPADSDSDTACGFGSNWQSTV